MLRRREQRVGQPFALIGRKKRLGQPGGLIGVPDPARLVEVSGIEDIACRRPRTVVRMTKPGKVLSAAGSQKWSAGPAMIFGAITVES